jgi:hydroxymethylpyrimidine pyrophosphatase-like HAD family hydrolase
MQISAILSDYDGTLCSTGSIRNQEENLIPADLEAILWNISEKIPVCIVSSKDFDFLHNKTKFANVISCILGIEMLVLRRHKETIALPTDSKGDLSDRISECQDFRCIKNNYLLVDDTTLQHNSKILSQLAEEIASDFNEVSIEQKFTITGQKALAGITIDWRHLHDWKSFKIQSEPRLREVIVEKQRELHHTERSNIHIQTYATHPFIDIYAAVSDKGMAYDRIISEIPITDNAIQKVMYLGDSENDNLAFRKADVSIGVRSDDRLSPKLDCKHTVKFDKLAGFLEKLQNDNFVFSGM